MAQGRPVKNPSSTRRPSALGFLITMSFSVTPMEIVDEDALLRRILDQHGTKGAIGRADVGTAFIRALALDLHADTAAAELGADEFAFAAHFGSNT